MVLDTITNGIVYYELLARSDDYLAKLEQLSFGSKLDSFLLTHQS